MHYCDEMQGAEITAKVAQYCFLEFLLMGSQNRSDGSVGSDVGTDNAEIYLLTANSFRFKQSR